VRTISGATGIAYLLFVFGMLLKGDMLTGLLLPRTKRQLSESKGTVSTCPYLRILY
jgi:hypothetical protein